ncbi:MAG TPA: potassium-transporting ATPase subunit KdpA, partial [Gemmatimonadaceae bacterium]|nr:potassium-transporting ATPase subunit KdpA [Gemmatimonadaceae bacterium]
MSANGWLQILFFSAVLLAVTKPMGIYVLKVYDGSFRWLSAVERVIYRVSHVDPEEDQHWTRYAASMLIFSAATMLVTYVALRLQHVLPL